MNSSVLRNAPAWLAIRRCSSPLTILLATPFSSASTLRSLEVVNISIKLISSWGRSLELVAIYTKVGSRNLPSLAQMATAASTADVKIPQVKKLLKIVSCLTILSNPLATPRVHWTLFSVSCKWTNVSKWNIRLKHVLLQSSVPAGFRCSQSSSALRFISAVSTSPACPRWQEQTLIISLGGGDRGNCSVVGRMQLGIFYPDHNLGVPFRKGRQEIWRKRCRDSTLRCVCNTHDNATSEGLGLKLLNLQVTPDGFNCVRSFVWHAQATIRDV